MKIGQVVKLNDNKEYIILNIMTLHNIKYLYLVTIEKPTEMLIAIEKEEEGNIVLDEIKDNDELDYILSQFVLTK